MGRLIHNSPFSIRYSLLSGISPLEKQARPYRFFLPSYQGGDTLKEEDETLRQLPPAPEDDT